MPRRWKIAIGIALAVVVLRVALTPALQWAIPWLAASQAGARLEIGDLSLELLAGNVTLSELVVAQPGSDSALPIDLESALLQMGRIDVEFEWLDLLQGKIHLPQLALDAPRVRLVQRADGSFALPVAPEPDTPGEDDATAADEPADPSLDPEPAESAESESAESESAEPESAEPDWEFVIDRFELKGTDVSVRNEASGEQVAQFAAARFGFESLAVGRDGTSLGGITLAQPEIRVQRDWMMNLGRSGDAPEEAEAGRETASIRLAHINVDSGAFTVQTPRGPLETAIRLEVTDLGTGRDHHFPIDVQVRLGEGNVALKGQLGLNPVFYQGHFAWNGLRIPPFLLLVFPDVVPWLNSCAADGDLEIVFRSEPGDGPVGLTAHGKSSVSEVSLKDPESGELALEWSRLEIDLRSGYYPLVPTEASPVRIEIAHAALIDPNIRYTNPPEAFDRFMTALANTPEEASAGVSVAEPEASAADAPTESIPEPEVAPEATDDEPGGPPPSISIDRFELSGGKLRYVDRSVSPTHETLISDLRAEIGNIATQPAAGAETILVKGVIQKTGSFELSGGLPGGNGKLRFELDRLDLVTYDSLARAAGWQLGAGSSTLKSDIHVDGESYRTDNHLVLHDLKVTPEKAGGFSATFGVSLDLALALLRDPFGDISISMPIAWEREELGVGMGSLIWSALRSAVMGALTSPFKLVGALIPDGGGPPSFDPIVFDAGSDQLLADHPKRIGALADLLGKRPNLALTLSGNWSPADTPVVAYQILQENALSGDAFPEIDDGGFFARRRVAAALSERASGGVGLLQPDDEALLQRYIDAQPVEDARLEALARARSDTLSAALAVAGVPLEAVAIESPATADEPGVSFRLAPRREEEAATEAPLEADPAE